MSLFGTLQMAGNALQTQQRGIQNAGANIANANTPGYTRRDLPLTELQPELPIGGGVTTSGDVRTVDQFLLSQEQRTSTSLAFATAREQSLSALEGLRAPSGHSPIDPALTDFFASLSALGSNPQSLPVRQDVLDKAQALSTQLHLATSDITSFRQGLDNQLADATTQASTLAKQLAGLNLAVTAAEANGQQASGLRDQRDQLASQLADLTGGSVLEDQKGNVNVLAFGNALVDGGNAQTISTRPNGATGHLDIVTTDAKSVTQVVTARVLGGTLGGIVSTRDGDAVTQQQGLDQLAYDLTTQMNTLHQAGFGLDGVSGRALFQPLAGSSGAAAAFALNPSVLADPRQLAASATLSGIPGDNGNALAMSNAQNGLLANGNSVTFAGAHQALIGALASATQVARDDETQRGDENTTATNLNSAVSGVSVDEELTRLMQFQRAYEASARVVKTVDTLFDTLENI